MNYFLFVKSKLGDFNSTKFLDGQGVVPVFDFVSGEKKLQKISAKQDKFIDNIIKNYTKDFLFYVDHYDLDLDVRYAGNIHPYSKYERLLAAGYNTGLVTGIDRDIAHNNEVMSLLSKYPNTPVLIRLLIEDILAPNLVLPQLKNLIVDLKEHTSRVDLVIDCRVFSESTSYYHAKIERFIQRFEKEAIDCIVVVTGSSIPEKINDIVKTGTSIYLDRKEAKLWRLVNAIPSHYICFAYGDYGVVSPDFEELDSNIAIPIVPKITYTFDESYYITRGFKTNTHPNGFGQYKDLAKDVTLLNNYRTQFSLGEKYIENIADKNIDGTGNPTTWITATMNQHIRYVNTII